MSFRIRLNKILQKEGINPKKLGEKLGYAKPDKLYRLLKDEKNSPSYQIVKDLLTVFPEINARWLITGEEEMLTLNEPQASYGFCADCVKKEAVIKYQEKIIKEKEQKIEEFIAQCTELRGKLERVTKNKAS